MISWFKRHIWLRWVLLVLAAGVGAWLVFGVFAFQTLFFDQEVNEPAPFFEAGPAPSGIAGDETTQEQADDMNEAMAESGMPETMEVDEPMPDMMMPETTTVVDTATTTTVATGTATTVVPETSESQIFVEATGSFFSRSHPTEGSVKVLGDGSGRRFLRLEDFRTDNGPDLNVYLSSAPTDAPAGDFDDDFVDLGDLKGNIGSQNYEIPPEIDLNHYSTVAIWCVRFGVVFGVAELS